MNNSENSETAAQESNEESCDDSSVKERLSCTENKPQQASSNINKKAKVKQDPKSESKAGVIYLSSVPDYMSVQKLRNTFEEYGPINRSFFQPLEKSFGYKKGLLFSEGWVEFKQKQTAKTVALALNATQVGGKKRYPWYSCIWNIKYLPKFTWTDVNADRELKRASYDSRIRADISQVKRQTNFIVNNFEKSKTISEIKKRKEKKGQVFEKRSFGGGIPQKLTDEEILSQKKAKRKAGEDTNDKKSKQPRKTFTGDEDKSRSFVMKNIFG